MNSTRTQTGVGLIEVLITLLVFSIGALAVAGLQASAKKNNYEALQRATAANLAQSIAAAMRANPTVLDAYVTGTATPLDIAKILDDPPKTCYQLTASPTVDCTPGQMAAFDLSQWARALAGASETAQVCNSGDCSQTKTRNTGGLVNPGACITGPAKGGSGIYHIIIVWRGVTRLGGNGTPCGQNSPLYGSHKHPASNAYQRFFDLAAYIEQ